MSPVAGESSANAAKPAALDLFGRLPKEAVEALRRDLQAYLRGHGPDASVEVTEVEAIPEGHSGFTYFVTIHGQRGVERAVLRVPPPGARPIGPADVVRQGKVMQAVREAGLPAPGIVAMDAEPVLDGRPFVLMERVPGFPIEDVLDRHSDADIAETTLAMLRCLHHIDASRSGLSGETPKSLSDEIERWAWLIERAPQELVQRGPKLQTALVANRPPDPPPTLVHADYHYGNVLFSDPDSGPCQVTAILDWEIAEIGAPLIDLGSLYVVGQRDVEVHGRTRRWLELDLPDIARLYGATFDETRWYFALGMYKYAAIYGYNLMLHRRGKRPDPLYETLTGTITDLIDRGLSLLNEEHV